LLLLCLTMGSKGVSVVLSADGVIALDVDAWVPGTWAIYCQASPRSLSASPTQRDNTFDIINYAADIPMSLSITAFDDIDSELSDNINVISENIGFLQHVLNRYTGPPLSQTI